MMVSFGGSWRIPATSPTRPASMVSELQFAAATSAHGDGFLSDKLQPARDLWTSSTRRRFRRWEWDPGENDVHCKNRELDLQDNRSDGGSVEGVEGDQIQEIGVGFQSHGDLSGGQFVDRYFSAEEEWRARLRADEEEWRARCRADDERWRSRCRASDERWESLLRAFKERLNSRRLSMEEDPPEHPHCSPIVRSNFQDDEVEEESLVDDASIWSEYEDDEDAEEDALPAISPARTSRMPTVIRRHFAHPPDVRLNSQGTSLDLVSSFTIDSTLVWGGDDDQSEEENEEEVQSVVDEGSLGGGNGNWNEIVEDMMIAEGVRRNVLPHLQLHDPTLEVESQGQRRNEKDWKVSDVNPKKKNHHALHCEESENDELLAWDIESIGDFIDKDQAASQLKKFAPNTSVPLLTGTHEMLPSASDGEPKPELYGPNHDLILDVAGQEKASGTDFMEQVFLVFDIAIQPRNLKHKLDKDVGKQYNEVRCEVVVSNGITFLLMALIVQSKLPLPKVMVVTWLRELANSAIFNGAKLMDYKTIFDPGGNFNQIFSTATKIHYTEEFEFRMLGENLGAMHLARHKRMKYHNEYINYTYSSRNVLLADYINAEERTSQNVKDYSDVFALSSLCEDDRKNGIVTEDYESLNAQRMQMISYLSALPLPSPCSGNHSQPYKDVPSNPSPGCQQVMDAIDLIEPEIKTGYDITSAIPVNSDDEIGSHHVQDMHPPVSDRLRDIRACLKSEMGLRLRNNRLSIGTANSVLQVSDEQGIAIEGEKSHSVQYEKVLLKNVTEEQLAPNLELCGIKAFL